MKPYDKTKAANRLKKLRDSRNWTQSKMAKELNSLLGHDDGGLKLIELSGDTGKQRVSQYEKGKGITLDLAFAYAQIFDVSLDYIYGYTDDKKPVNKPIKDHTGLSDDAINTVHTINVVEKDGYYLQQSMDFINAFLSMKVANSLFRPVEAYRKCVEFCTFMEQHYADYVDFTKEMYSTNKMMKRYHEALAHEGENVEPTVFEKFDELIAEDEEKNKILEMYHERKNKLPYLLFDVQQAFIAFITDYGISNFNYDKYNDEVIAYGIQD